MTITNPPRELPPQNGLYRWRVPATDEHGQPCQVLVSLNFDHRGLRRLVRQAAKHGRSSGVYSALVAKVEPQPKES